MPGVFSYSLSPFKNDFSKEHLLHLLRRSLFGVGFKEFIFFKEKSLDRCLDILVQQSPVSPPVKQGNNELKDPFVAEGDTWVNAPFENTVIDTRRRLMLKMWWVEHIVNRDYSLTEKMTLFWHNHFVTEMDIVKDSRYSYQYVAMLRSNALGNFKQIVREGTTNVAMLVYLNGNNNSKSAPNENFSRELMELFTLGKTADVHYTEEDVKAAARVLSGWKDDKESIKARFYPDLHDTNDKKFSPYFEDEIIKGRSGTEGMKEIDALVDMIFKRRETAKFVCRNIYRWFVTAQIDEQAEKQIIEPLAQIFIDNRFEIAPVLRTLLGSEHFFDAAFRGCIVKNPVEYFLGSMQQFDILTASKLAGNHEIWIDFYVYLGFMSMDIGNPPSVAGWPAYYQAPKFHQWWINSSTLSLRSKVLNDLCTQEGLFFNGVSFNFNFIPFVKQLEKPSVAEKLTSDAVQFLCAANVNPAEKSKLIAALNAEGQSNKSWSSVWNQYIAKPDDTANLSEVENRLRLFFKRIINMPEYQMM